MGNATLRDTAARLVAQGRAGSCPVAVVERGWTVDQRVTLGTLADVADRPTRSACAPRPSWSSVTWCGWRTPRGRGAPVPTRLVPTGRCSGPARSRPAPWHDPAPAHRPGRLRGAARRRLARDGVWRHLRLPAPGHGARAGAAARRHLAHSAHALLGRGALAAGNVDWASSAGSRSGAVAGCGGDPALLAARGGRPPVMPSCSCCWGGASSSASWSGPPSGRSRSCLGPPPGLPRAARFVGGLVNATGGGGGAGRDLPPAHDGPGSPRRVIGSVPPRSSSSR